MAITLIMNINPNQGYAPDQVKKMTLLELRGYVEEAIEDYGEDAEFVTLDGGNAYGAKYGSLDSTFGQLFEEAELRW